jgi:3-hydroxy acid dehydrogenase/malonic semialdehyde reductase
MPFLGRSLEGEVAYITGASSGIGAATALRLASLGAQLVLCARRRDRLDDVSSQIQREFPETRIFSHTCDVRDDDAVAAWLAAGDQHVGPPTILVNNAGLAKGADRVTDAVVDDWDLMIDTNVRSVVRLTKRVLPGMIARGRGDIVMIGSVAGSDTYAGGSVYCATKAAVQVFANALRKEVLGTPLRVMNFEPGMVDTEFSVVRFAGDTERAGRVYQGVNPLRGDDIADCIAFAITRPLHMSLDRMLILATDQAGATLVHRRPA